MISRSELQKIGQLRDPNGQLLSLYLPLFQESSNVDYNIELKNLLRSANQRYVDSTGTSLPEGFDALFEDLRVYVRDNAGKYGRGIALFASPEYGILRTLAMPGSVESSAIVAENPNLAPLIRLLEDNQPYCLCVVSRDQARLFLGHVDEIEEIEQVRDEEVPGQHDQGGWSQARFERHIEDHVHRHFKNVANRLFELLDEQRFEILILGGPEEVVAGFEDGLHPYVRERLIGSVRLLLEANVNQAREQALSVIAQNVRSRKQEAIQRVVSEAGARDLGVEGLTETMAALQRGQILNLVVDSQVHSSGINCPDCGGLSLTPDQDNTCPYCQSANVQDIENIVPRLITTAFEQGASVYVIDDEEQKADVSRIGGIGALLRFRVDEQTA